LFTQDPKHDPIAEELYSLFNGFLKSCKKIEGNLTLLLKHHPRATRESIKTGEKLAADHNAIIADNNLLKCFKQASLLITTHSTTSFEAAAFYIPTFFLDYKPGKTLYKSHFSYPLIDLEPIAAIKKLINKPELYNEYAKSVYRWYTDFYAPLNITNFTNLAGK
jgi:lipid A disaccharide synthetase